ncbi:hypothetical protein GGI12_006036, partial [Dipsacomyces acuminosporus]
MPATAIGMSPHSQTSHLRTLNKGGNAESAPAAGRRFLRTPSNPDLQLSSNGRQTDTSDKDAVSSSERRPNLALKQPNSSTNSNNANGSTPTTPGGYSGVHRPLQAKLETSSRNHSDSERAGGSAETRQRTRTIPVTTARAGRSVVGTAGTKPSTWRTQQPQPQHQHPPQSQARHSGESKALVGGLSQRTPAANTGISGAKLAIRETSGSTASRGKSSSEDARDDSDSKSQMPRLRPTQSKPMHVGGTNASFLRNPNAISSSVSAVGVGSYTSANQGARGGAPRAGAAASVVGAVAPPVPLQTHPLVGNQGARPQLASFQQR